MEMNSLADDAELNSPDKILHTDTSPNVVSVNLILKTTRVTELLILTFLDCEKKKAESERYTINYWYRHLCWQNTGL